MIQKETSFIPTDPMFKVLNAAINPDVDPNITAWCKAAGVARVQWYRWQEIEGFIDWFNAEFKRSMEGIRASLIKVGIQKAHAGDFQFWKVMMEKAGEYGPSMRLESEGGPIVIIDAGKNPYNGEAKKYLPD